jgi:hypothetical protein
LLQNAFIKDFTPRDNFTDLPQHTSQIYAVREFPFTEKKNEKWFSNRSTIFYSTLNKQTESRLNDFKNADLAA